MGVLVTCLSEAAEEPQFMVELAERGLEAIRINCAPGEASAWQKMIDHAKAAEAETGHRMRAMMDLDGPKIRTGQVAHAKGTPRVLRGDVIAIASQAR